MGRWWRLFVEKVTGTKTEDVPSTVPRRRRHERYPTEETLSARCESWSRFHELMSGDVSLGGLFICTERPSRYGETVDIEMTLPDGKPFVVKGKVVRILTADQAAALNRKPGLGIELSTLDPDMREAYNTIVERARANLPTPASPGRGAATAPPPVPAKKTIVGIDLGTTHTSVAAVIDNKVQILQWPGGLLYCPSVVAFPDGHSCIVGDEARKRMASDPLRTIQSPKRLLGRDFDDPEIQGFLHEAPYRTLRGPDGSVIVEIGAEQYAITQLCAYLLEDARKVASDVLGHPVHECVLTMPVSFDGPRAQLLKRAAELAQLEVRALIDEPSAAALANRFGDGFGGIVGVYDFGGGTFDFSIVDVSKGDFVVLATAGDTWLGGDDFDSTLADVAAETFWKETQVDLRRQAVEMQKLRFATERAKRLLSTDDAASIFIADALRTSDGMIDLNQEITRQEFNQLCAPLIERTIDTCMEALELVDMKPQELSAIFLSGGTTRIPVVQQRLAHAFGVPVKTGVPPEYAVCLGAAIHAAQLGVGSTATLLSRDD